MELTNKVVVITGASKGLGKEIAKLLVDEKCKLALVARSEKELGGLTENLKKSGVGCEYFICDVSDSTKVAETIQKIVEKFGRIDILVNNAGIYSEGPLESHTPERVKEIFDVVALGTIYTTLATVPQMKRQKFGQILNVISVAGVETPGEFGPYTPYTAAKYAITGFTKATAEELIGTGIKIMGFYPAGMNTDIYRAAGINYSDDEDWMMDKVDMAKIVVFMLKQPDDVLIDQLVVHKLR
jgi:short-subunit dehydrogenase